MTEKRFYLMNVEDPLHEYGRWCKPVLEDGETGKQYENALEVMDLLNEFNDENEELKTRIQLLSTLLDNADTIIDLSNNGMAKAFWKKRNNEVEQEYKMKYKKRVLE